MNNPKISLISIYSKQGEGIKNFISNIVNQTFKDFEFILVNSESDEETVSIVSDISQSDERIKLINLPYNEDYKFAQNVGIEVASGDYICFISTEENITCDFIQNLYYENVKSKKDKISLMEGKLYRRSFVENNNDIEEIIQDKINLEKQALSDVLLSNETNIKEELDKCYKNSENTINNKIYDLTVRFNALEKTLYDKEKEICENVSSAVENAVNIMHKNNDLIYSDISKVYDYINSEVNQKGCEINKVYEEITKNYGYTEKLVEENKQNLYSETGRINRRLEEVLKENEIRYNNLQKLIEVTSDELRDKIESLNLSQGSGNEYSIQRISELLNMERTINDKINELYKRMDRNNKEFYEELSNLYKELKK